ncbi:hypothetical protein LMH87_011109 [Akanthomyces muscarius]|uniref:Uncharacterized protein n=1 Tax=Akanthomyces muscarius TaxID=2231603 RepID=A0A9W8Q8I4_AKAMU|nr:hypothetical protein LMH87_011109 [Akanthomyces muscarius]KAJ4150357.1 hypothetical protein LMH87_011109 [Akanthomyces muscarius]
MLQDGAYTEQLCLVIITDHSWYMAASSHPRKVREDPTLIKLGIEQRVLGVVILCITAVPALDWLSLTLADLCATKSPFCLHRRCQFSNAFLVGSCRSRSLIGGFGHHHEHQ